MKRENKTRDQSPRRNKENSMGDEMIYKEKKETEEKGLEYHMGYT